ncbi:transcriptional regulatory [Hyphodiscus hymeniophilus]|uniref:Transcriptional regulatory n=1 Tax=Hyphodiscus hymeniophilus TaxID=353542 RepID=A0A9P6VS37_9HELO|nr:transcriptional regulatory [Hyphodiscus hymeniophilus]
MGGKRVKATRACDRCKKKKSKCSGEQPCDRCNNDENDCAYTSEYTRGREPIILTRIIPQAIENHETTHNEENNNEVVSLLLLSDVPRSPRIYNSHHAELDSEAFNSSSGRSIFDRTQNGLRAKDSKHQELPISMFGDPPLPAFDGSFLLLPSAETARGMMDKYFDDIAATVLFLHRPTVDMWMESYTTNILSSGNWQRGIRAIILMIFAIAHGYVDSEPGYQDSSMRYFLSADYQLQHEMGQIRLTSIQARLMQCMYLLSRSRINQCWSTFGVVVNMITALGLNRKHAYAVGKDRNVVYMECQKRAFWSAYTLDKYLSNCLGRPQMLHDEDIDQDLPLSVSDGDLQLASIAPGGGKVGLGMQAALFQIKLSVIIGKILKDLYGIRKLECKTRLALTDKHERLLEQWRQGVAASFGFDFPHEPPPASTDSIVRNQNAALMLTRHHVIILLFRPFFLDTHSEIPPERVRIQDHVQRCLDTCMSIIEIVNRLYEKDPAFRARWVYPPLAAQDGGGGRFILYTTWVYIEHKVSASANEYEYTSLCFGAVCDRFSAKVGGHLPNLQAKPDVQIPPSISAARFESEQELHFFQSFRKETASQIAGPLKSLLWGRLVPQTSESTPFVRHAMIAIAAMSQISREAGNSQAALGYISLKGIRDATTRNQQDLRTSLIACLLVFCFEILQGSERSARALAFSGLTLFHHSRGIDMTSPTLYKSPSLLEDELLSAFVSLDIQVLFFLDDRPLGVHQQIIEESTEALNNMQSRFATREEANRFWQIMLQRSLHVKAKTESDQIAWLGAPRGASLCTPDFPTGQLHFSQLKEHSAEIRRECQLCIGEIHRWTKAASQVLERITRTDHNWTVIASLLQIHAKTSLIVLADMTFTDETSFDVFLPYLRAITNLSSGIHQQLVESSRKSGVHHVDLGILPALNLVATRCRDKAVRARAIDLLYSIPYREGIWDSIAIASVGDWLRSIEFGANGGDETHIPEYHRVVSASTNLDLFTRTATFYCTQRTGSKETDMVNHEEILSW